MPNRRAVMRGFAALVAGARFRALLAPLPALVYLNDQLQPTDDAAWTKDTYGGMIHGQPLIIGATLLKPSGQPVLYGWKLEPELLRVTLDDEGVYTVVGPEFYRMANKGDDELELIGVNLYGHGKPRNMVRSGQRQEKIRGGDSLTLDMRTAYLIQLT